MVIQHNLTAMNANRMENIVTGIQRKSMEKLSSGYKVNRAADDAAGLAISEKMRRQIRGLLQASANAQDGISCVQTAEGALNEITDMLQRMNELAVKSANGTNSQSDRQYIQDEVNQLLIEIDRVSSTTKFNETYLLKGDDHNYDAFTVPVKVRADGGGVMPPSIPGTIVREPRYEYLRDGYVAESINIIHGPLFAQGGTRALSNADALAAVKRGDTLYKDAFVPQVRAQSYKYSPATKADAVYGGKSLQEALSQKLSISIDVPGAPAAVTYNFRDSTGVQQFLDYINDPTKAGDFCAGYVASTVSIGGKDYLKITKKTEGYNDANTTFGTDLTVTIKVNGVDTDFEPTTRTNGLDEGIYSGTPDISNRVYTVDSSGTTSTYGTLPTLYVKDGTTELSQSEIFSKVQSNTPLYTNRYTQQTQQAVDGTDYTYTPGNPGTPRTLYDAAGRALTAKQARELLDNGDTVYADQTQTTAVTSATMNNYIQQNGFITTITPPERLWQRNRYDYFPA